ncbi:MAG: hypothetical protein MK135_12965 [Polyangiaceae bacterium]|nr:hypothetical protein [Polyangiaceae bacterium]
MTTTTTDPMLRRTYWFVAIAGLVLALLAQQLQGLEFAASAALGALIAGGNLYLLSRTVVNLMAGQRASWGAVAVLKFAGLLLLTYFVFQFEFVAPLGLALGFGALPLGIVAAAAFGVPPEAPTSKDSALGDSTLATSPTTIDSSSQVNHRA